MASASIYTEIARVLRHESLHARQYLLRLDAPHCAESVLPGNFIHLSCSHNPYELKRPFSVLRASGSEGWIEILYKVVGKGTEKLSHAKIDDTLHCLGPIGNTFTLSENTKRPILLGGGVGIPPILFFAEHVKKNLHIQPFTIMGSEIPFPFKVQPSKIMIDGLPGEAIGAMTLLEDLGIPSRLTSKQGYSGCFNGYIHELADLWIQTLSNSDKDETEIFACGPEPMLRAVAELSYQHDIPCQLSLEEYMACAVGGCAGCTVTLTDSTGKNFMKRVCVDGPIFNANEVYCKNSI
jgi:dihydroorotate dehydrogenase electron transfer subunit